MEDTVSLGTVTCELTPETPTFTTELIYDNLTGHQAEARRFNIIHFNDVYNIESRDAEPVGGASRFVTALESLIAKAPTIVLFSGDAIMPSSGNFTFQRTNSSHINYEFSLVSVLLNSQYSRQGKADDRYTQ